MPAVTEPISLHDLLTTSELDMPSLTKRITLMRLLAETVERLHAVDWLHKGLRSSNILLFPHARTGEINYADPLISGFDYLRPATDEDMSEIPSDNPAADIYRHPFVRSRNNCEDGAGRESYKKSFDLYSLGIVLLEIEYWKTVDSILGIHLDDASPRQTRCVQKRLLIDEPRHLKWVKSHVGDTVEGMVRACLSRPEAFGLDRNADEKRDAVAAMLQREFGERFVGKLAGMKGL